MDNEILLLTVENYFQIEGRGLIVTPLLDLYDDRRYVGFPFRDTVTVQRPDKTEGVFEALFYVEHQLLIGGGGRVVCPTILPNGTKESVPIGSKLLISPQTQEKLKGEPV